ncbi:MAG: double-strand break repair protein AddB [Rhodospirillales bacterium]|nr:double-strand break repair protein AddB [Rhodospirillales bacterium]
MSVFTIAPGLSFVDELAAGLLDRLDGADPLALAAATILVPTRRAERALADAFLRQGAGKPLLLPRFQPLGDLDAEEMAFAEEADLESDLPPAIHPLRRQLRLAKLVRAFKPGIGWDQAARLALELARFLDQVQTEGLALDGLKTLVPADYAEHWQEVLAFLDILATHWPKALAEEGALDPAMRRNRRLDWQAEHWRRQPPAGPVIVAGSTGSLPATARLIAAVNALPQGWVVLPGLDALLDEASWRAIDEDHPQFAMKHLLERLGVAREAVKDWRPSARAATPKARLALLSQALKPAPTTASWRDSPSLDRSAIEGVLCLEAPGPREEAGAIALLMRQTLEEEGATAALVTPDRALARRVAAELERWAIAIDDSAGRPLADTPPGLFFRLLARAVAGRFAPLDLLALLKHPLAALGLAPAELRRRVRGLELAKLRGPRPAPGLAALRDGVQDVWLERLDEAQAPLARLIAAPEAPIDRLLAAQVALAEAVAASDALTGAARLWMGEDGEALAHFVAELAGAARDLDSIEGAAWPTLLETLMENAAVRPAYGRHPRLHIWGPLEARLQQADRMILGGLNEGVWPAPPPADPWLSRPMRKAFGLPSPERRIGLAAHDFVQGAAAPRLVLTRSRRVQGTPTQASRWLLRLEAAMRALGLAQPDRRAPWADDTPLHWEAGLDQGPWQGPRRPPAQAPRPCPPVAARPRRLSVTEIETWMRDPYALYARRILNLKPLEPLDALPGDADFGNLVHGLLDAFLKLYPEDLPGDPQKVLVDLAAKRIEDFQAFPGLAAYWWPRLRRIAGWVAEAEAARRQGKPRCWSEIEGRLAFEAPGGTFTLSAKADRIERLGDGSLALLDYKTGALPSQKEVKAGFAPQLPLEAAIARQGGFADLPAAPIAQLVYWRLSGDRSGGREWPITETPASELADQALARLKELVARFDRPETPYLAQPVPGRANRRSEDYAHLARLAEWQAAPEEDGAEESEEAEP